MKPKSPSIFRGVLVSKGYNMSISSLLSYTVKINNHLLCIKPIIKKQTGTGN